MRITRHSVVRIIRLKTPRTPHQSIGNWFCLIVNAVYLNVRDTAKIVETFVNHSVEGGSALSVVDRGRPQTSPLGQALQTVCRSHYLPAG
jgi:hypothetical protein